MFIQFSEKIVDAVYGKFGGYKNHKKTSFQVYKHDTPQEFKISIRDMLST